mmetsp:Transcript_71165/g.224810  ORF Transcript_71165/g.224810 Transcript_71165/m.224810 type:complete len:412 (+) Transcript_71165:398-1633(+)
MGRPMNSGTNCTPCSMNGSTYSMGRSTHSVLNRRSFSIGNSSCAMWRPLTPISLSKWSMWSGAARPVISVGPPQLGTPLLFSSPVPAQAWQCIMPISLSHWLTLADGVWLNCTPLAFSSWVHSQFPPAAMSTSVSVWLTSADGAWLVTPLMFSNLMRAKNSPSPPSMFSSWMPSTFSSWMPPQFSPAPPLVLSSCTPPGACRAKCVHHGGRDGIREAKARLCRGVDALDSTEVVTNVGRDAEHLHGAAANKGWPRIPAELAGVLQEARRQRVYSRVAGLGEVAEYAGDGAAAGAPAVSQPALGLPDADRPRLAHGPLGAHEHTTSRASVSSAGCPHARPHSRPAAGLPTQAKDTSTACHCRARANLPAAPEAAAARSAPANQRSSALSWSLRASPHAIPQPTLLPARRRLT